MPENMFMADARLRSEVHVSIEIEGERSVRTTYVGGSSQIPKKGGLSIPSVSTSFLRLCPFSIPIALLDNLTLKEVFTLSTLQSSASSSVVSRDP